MRATLVCTVRQQGSSGLVVRGGRAFHAGAVGYAAPLHRGDGFGLWLWESVEDGTRVLVPRAAFRLQGEREPASLPPRPASRWRSLDSQPVSVGAAELEALLAQIRGELP